MATAYVLINCEPGHEPEVIKELSKIKEVKEVYGTYGVYDIIAKVVSDSMDSLQNTVIGTITTMSGIHSKLTLIAIEGQGN